LTEKRKKKEKTLHIAKLQRANAKEMAQRTYEAELTEHYYLEKNPVQDCCDTSPLLLDTVLS